MGTERRAAWLRACGFCLVLGAEYLALGVMFDGSKVARTAAGWSGLAHLGSLVSMASAIATAFVIALLRARQTVAPAPSELAPIRWGWGALHASAFAVLWLFSRVVFSSRVFDAGSIALLTSAWFGAGALSMLTLKRWLFAERLNPLVTSAGRAALLVGALSGVAIWLVAGRNELLWQQLAAHTLLLSGALLRLFSEHVVTDTGQALLGLDGFTVVIAPACSGVEGMTLISLFMASYLYLFRGELRFQTAWLLLPLGVIVAFFINVLRIAALLMLGAWLSPNIALGGFHSKAGWLGFCLVALGLVFLARRSPWFSRSTPPTPATTRDDVLLAFCLPALALTATGMLTGAFAGSLDLAYGARIAVCLGLLVRYRQQLTRLVQPPSAWSLLIGLAVFAVWLLLLPPADASALAATQTELDSLSPGVRVAWTVLRILGSLLIVPIAEELAFRGYFQRRLMAVQFENVSFRSISLGSLVIPSLAFGLLHGNWAAAVIAGAAYACAAALRDRLADAVVAHATTNALLCGWVLAFNRWDAW